MYQILGEDQKAVKTATSAPGCFVHGKDVFSEPVKGNAVQFFVTGTEYFDNVARAIEGAQSSVFITGWQVNFDVVLTGKKTLWTCLRTAVRNGASVYVMPWMSPKVGVDTGDLETALTVIQLNAGLAAPRAFVLPAVSQCDQPGALGIAFSHHQKLVVIDNKFAYVGGIDLAYGRRDDGKYSLKAEGRQGSEFYNSCVPPIHSLSSVEQTAYLTRAELVAACFDNKAGRAAQFFLSAPMKPLAGAMDAYSAASDKIKDVNKQISDWWVTSDVVPEFVRKAQDQVIDAAQETAADVSKWANQQLGAMLQTKIEKLREYGGAQLKDATTALMAWLNGATLDSLPPTLLQSTADTIQAFVMRLVLALQAEGSQRKQCYANLEKLGKLLPAGGKCPDSSVQPRMPWHDVHCRIEGPSVYDLSRNFVRRWNGVALQYERSDGRTVDPLLRQLGIAARLKVPRIGAAHRPARSKAQPGSCWVQVLRSAPKKMRVAEAAGEAEKTAPSVAESSCLSAMLKNIEGASHFIYIEGQFFQSDYGSTMIGEAEAEADGGAPVSGPMHALMDVKGSPGYRKYAAQLGILGVPPGQIHKSLKWSQLDDVQRDIKGGGADFVNDLKRVMATQAQIAGFAALGPSQKSLKNPICQALGDRITRAIYDGKPFHVYMVLPVHPEGTLDTVNIMTQQHLTMQSLVFGSQSLVNRIRRALLAMKYVRERKMEVKRAQEAAKNAKLKELDEQIPQEDWERYLTLLNLRNWDRLNGRPVTEQIYVHSKLLIVDDRVVVLGSANINDRSQLGDRDSELAIIVHDDTPSSVRLDGQHLQSVSTFACRLRKALWQKHFGLMDGAARGNNLALCLEQPAAKETWEMIQAVARRNASAYERAFPFLPRLNEPTSIWPTWNRAKGELRGYMPFNDRFWRGPEPRDEGFTWDAKLLLPERAPTGIRGFIVALPVMWMQGENSNSGMNLTTLANVGPEERGESMQTATLNTSSQDRLNA
ncbi:phospholipase D-like domain-containing protein [Cupriavidus sp. MP-37]|uniref:phospholipase D-like domain-containing protein n=1 Tax=Cupriavidus sp. MP-37 TaxID=2884455 RepID=UPI001D0AE583|nr:phospholipase D-like domain-containing protein [Cupriavidus sp. MP-37]UDM53381.1 phospholipase [Cupriavidus sp. MP-37]